MKKLAFVLFLFLPFKIYAYSSSASSAILMDMNSGRIIYGKNIYHVQSVASISKIMTAVVAIENDNINKEVVIGDEVLKAYGSGIYVKVGERLKLKDLLYGLMLRSGNDAALAIAKTVSGDTLKFVHLMNEKAKELGMKDSVFNNPSGLDEEAGNMSSAYDMAVLMSYAMKNKDFKKIVSTKVYKVRTDKNIYVWHNKNKLLSSYKYITGGKTGFTKIAKRTLVTSALKNGLSLTVVTLNDGNDWFDHKKLYEEAFSEYTSYRILTKGEVKILGEDYYNNDILYLNHDFDYPLLEDEKNIIKIKYVINKNRNYKTGDVIGNANVYLGNEVIGSRPIYVKVKNRKISFWDKIFKRFRK